MQNSYENSDATARRRPARRRRRNRRPFENATYTPTYGNEKKAIRNRDSQKPKGKQQKPHKILKQRQEIPISRAPIVFLIAVSGGMWLEVACSHLFMPGPAKPFLATARQPGRCSENSCGKFYTGYTNIWILKEGVHGGATLLDPSTPPWRSRFVYRIFQNDFPKIWPFRKSLPSSGQK